jgi:hypothetical protein
VPLAEKLVHGKTLDTVALYTPGRMVDALSSYATLGYVGFWTFRIRLCVRISGQDDPAP